MKQLMLLISLLVIVSSCENTEVVKSVMQAEIDNDFFRALDARVTRSEDGTYLIQGITQRETLTLRVTDLIVTNYNFGGNNTNYGLFENLNGDTYFTNPHGSGFVAISNYNEEAQTVTGSFNFEAVIEGVDTIAIHQGIFFEAPILNPLIDDDPTIIDPATNAGTFVSYIDGIPFNPFSVSAVETDDSIEIRGFSPNRSVTLTVPKDITPDNYVLPMDGIKAVYEDNDGIQQATTGNIIVFSHDTASNHIKGTFFFLTDTKAITLGQFNVIYN